MAQEQASAIATRARIVAQDNDANSNYAVGSTTLIVLFNKVLRAMKLNTKTKTIAASTTGLTFSSGSASQLISGVDIVEFESFHPSNSSALSYPLSTPLYRVSVPEMMDLLGYDGDNTLGAADSDWQVVAAESTQDDTGASGAEKWRVYGWPVINRTRSMHIKAVVPVTITALTDYPDIPIELSPVASDLLGYEIAKLKKETSQSFLDNILRGIPREFLPSEYGGAVRQAQLQDGVEEVRD